MDASFDLVPETFVTVRLVWTQPAVFSPDFQAHRRYL